MSSENVTPIRPPAKQRRRGNVPYRTYSNIENDLNRVKCTLACASAALGKAEDEADGDLAAQSCSVIRACVRDLGRVENELDEWYVHHEHSPKVATDGH
jgi:hypothetical protein